jgi:hypothetical protein
MYDVIVHAAPDVGLLLAHASGNRVVALPAQVRATLQEPVPPGRASAISYVAICIRPRLGLPITQRASLTLAEHSGIDRLCSAKKSVQTEIGNPVTFCNVRS